MNARVDLIYFDAGGGHRNAAQALQKVAEQQHRAWDVRLVNLQEALDSLDVFRKLFKIRLQDIYNLVLRHGWTLGSTQLLPLMQAVIRLYHRPTVRLLEDHWNRTQPDLVVSMVPHFNRALLESLRHARGQTPFVTVLTDLADYPPHFWIERQEQFLVVGSQKAFEQATAMGHSRDRVRLTSGMILHPRFYEQEAADRKDLGFDGRVTGLLLFGGWGSPAMEKIVERLEDLPLQLIVICGRNQKLEQRLRSRKTRIPLHVVGFTGEVPRYMRMADFMIGKPGPGSVSEAVAMGLPVIVERNAWTLPQERYNAEWILENEVGLVARDFRRVAGMVETFLDRNVLQRYRANTAKIRNRAIFEIPDFLEEILRSARQG